MKLIVGLGNPGNEYKNTRHNVGFLMLDAYIKDDKNWKEKFNGLYIERFINQEKVIFLKPLSFMNLSGEVVKKYMDFFHIDINDILIIHDDLDLNLGVYRLRSSGSSGGHNGLKNIEKNIGSNEYKRLKIGISNDKSIDTKNYVLGHFSENEKRLLDNIFKTVKNIIDDFFIIDFNSLMNKYNHKK
ncbi:MAG: aminoacyl-tRNA hydrolase [Bacilli bacterium]|nr:aminoacyl-tRNA hydrolase [Bacilli bacterium]